MRNKLYWGIAILITLIGVSIVLLVIGNNRDVETAPELGKVPNEVLGGEVQSETFSAIPSSDRKVYTEPKVASPSEKKVVSLVAEKGSGDVVARLEKELSRLSLKEIVVRLDDIDTEVLRKFFELDTAWFRELVEGDARRLSSEEQVALEIAFRRAFPEEKEEYEAKSGLPAPPPGYTYFQDGDNPPELIKYNTPIVRINPNGVEGYGNWDQFTDSEWNRYKVLDAIANDNKSIWEDWDIEVPREVVERAKELRQPLYEKSFGTRPSISVSGVYTRDKTTEDEELESKLRTEANAKLSKQRQRRKHDYQKTDVVAAIREIASELRQR